MTTPGTLWGTNIAFRVSSAAPDAEPVWVDFTSYVIIPGGSSIQAFIGRLTELSRTTDPGTASLQLLNPDDEVTPGSPVSPFSPWFKQARRAQIVETIAGYENIIADFYLEQPENVAVQQPTDGGPDFITLMISGLDVVGRFRRGRKFRPALVEHIIYHGGTDLDGLWALTQAGAPFDGVGPVATPVDVLRRTSGTIGPIATEQPQAGDTPTAAESSGLRCTLITDAATGSVAYQRISTPSTFLPAVGSGEAWTCVFWFSLNTDISPSFQQVAVFNFTGSATTDVTMERNVTTGALTLTCSGAMAGTLSGGILWADGLLPIGVRWDPAGATMELWQGSVRQTVSLTGSAPTGIALAAATIGYQISFDISHLQFYSGTWSYSDFLTQIHQAYAPLDRQCAGERINTVLDYAGFPAGRRQIDAGAAVMQPVTMSGKTADQLIGEALTTEQGRFFARAGNVIFHDRRTVLNV